MSLDVLLELASRDILFHNTNVNSAKLILDKMAFTLPLAETNESETQVRVFDKKTEMYRVEKRHMPGLYYLSFARSLSSGYIADRSKNLHKVANPITFVLDGNVLKSRNRGIKFSSLNYWNMDSTGRSMGSAREAEERLFSNNRNLSIQGAIKEVLIVIDGRYGSVWNERRIYTLCLRNKIPCKLFTLDNFQGFLRRRETKEDKAKALEMLKSATRDRGYQSGADGVTPTSSKAVRKHYNSTMPAKQRSYNELESLELLVERKSYGNLPERVRQYLRSYDGLHSRFKSFLHNLRSDVGRGGPQPARFDRLLKKMKAKSIEDFFTKLEKKWEPLIDIYNQREREKYLKNKEQNQ